ncbi:connectin [Chrysoperla carnea]|uniref:connectin n=1 Tax=Chrysoperla carnea TaxID=189513 RepID=UPI001D07BF87|nr:connectin [Chrysoperla carnea]
MHRNFRILFVICICIYLSTCTPYSPSSAATTGRRKSKDHYVEKLPSRAPQILCQNDDPTAAIHCFCNTDVFNNASRAECFVFSNVTEDNPIWSTFTTQVNMMELIITLRSDKKLCFVPTEALKPLRRLKKLTIKYASITEIHSYAFANSSSVREITISRNQIEVLAPYAIAHLPSLEILTLDKNRLSELNRNVFYDLPRLQNLYISENNLTVIHDNAFNHLGALHNLELDRNAIGVVTRDTFAGLSALKRLDLSFNRLTILGDLTFAELWSLEALILENNELQVISERAFDGLTQLKQLTLKKNYLKALPNGLLEGVPTVNNLDLRHNQLQTLTRENIQPIFDTLRNTSSFLYIEQNKFICDCRLSWMHKLRNETKNSQVRNVLDEVTCRFNRVNNDDESIQDKITITSSVMRNHNTNGIRNSLNDHNIDSDADLENMDDMEEDDYDDNFEQNTKVATSFVISSDHNKHASKHLLNIPPETLPCPQPIKFPTGAPNTALHTPMYKDTNFFGPSFGSSWSSQSSYILVLSFLLISFIHHIVTGA